MQRIQPTATFGGRYYLYEAGAYTFNALSVTPLLFDARCVALTDNFQYYRFTDLEVIMFNNTDTVNCVIGYSPGLTTNNPNTFQEISDLPVSRMGNGQYGSPNPGFKVPPKTLKPRQSPWLRRGTTYDDLLEVQGTFFYGSGTQFSTSPATILVKWKVQVCAPLDPSNTVPRNVPALQASLVRRLLELRAQQRSAAQAVLDRDLRVESEDPIDVLRREVEALTSITGSVRVVPPDEEKSHPNTPV